MADLPHLAGRLLGVPLLVSRPRLDALMAVIGPRLSGGRLDAEDFAGFADADSDETPASVPSVSVIRVAGSLCRRTYGLMAMCGLTSYESIKADIQAGLDDSNIKAIVLDIDSGGGEAGGVFDLADFIFASRGKKPIIAVSNESAYSAAYAIASAADRIYVPRTGGVGSIGVVAMHCDQSAADREAGLSYEYVFAGDKKVDGNPHAPLGEGARADLQREINRLYGMFCDTVARNRGLSAEAVMATQAGTYYGAEAVAAGLADVVGTMETALADLSASLVKTAATATAARNGNKKMARKKLKLEAVAEEAPVEIENEVPASTLTEDVAPDAAELPVADASEFADGEQVVQIEDERIEVSGVSEAGLVVAENGRGAAGTDAVAHPAGAPVVAVTTERTEGTPPASLEAPAAVIEASVSADLSLDALAPSAAQMGYFSAVTELCALAGVEKGAALDFVSKGMSLGDVRKELLARRAKASDSVKLDTTAKTFDEHADVAKALGAAPWGDVLAKVENKSSGGWGDVASRLNNSK